MQAGEKGARGRMRVRRGVGSLWTADDTADGPAGRLVLFLLFQNWGNEGIFARWGETVWRAHCGTVQCLAYGAFLAVRPVNSLAACQLVKTEL